MTNIEIDIETYSDVDLQKCGVYEYSESDNFESVSYTHLDVYKRQGFHYI